VRDISVAADDIAHSGDLTRRIAVPSGSDEAGRLAATFNRMLERVEASFQREQRFIREASHELRTPMTICRGYLEVLPDDPRPEELRETVAVVVDELGRMGRILDDMATLARAEDPGFVRSQTIEVSRLLADVARSAEPLMGDRLEVRPPPAGAWMRGDPQRLAQAMLNLLQNAALHGAGGTVRLGARPDGDGWRIEVDDHGGESPPRMRTACSGRSRAARPARPGRDWASQSCAASPRPTAGRRDSTTDRATAPRSG